MRFKLLIVIGIVITLSGCSDIDTDQSIDECTITISEDEDNVGEINGYLIRRNSMFCTALVGNITIDGYDFGYFANGCSGDIDDIGYHAFKDGETYALSALIVNDLITVREVYELYICDEGKCGSNSTFE